MDISNINLKSAVTALRDMSLDLTPLQGEIGGRKVLVLRTGGNKIEASEKGEKIKFATVTAIVERALVSKDLSLKQKADMVRHFSVITKDYNSKISKFSLNNLFKGSKKNENLEKAQSLIKNIGTPIVKDYEIFKMEEKIRKAERETKSTPKSSNSKPTESGEKSKRASTEGTQEAVKQAKTSAEPKEMLVNAKNAFLNTLYEKKIISKEDIGEVKSLDACRALYKKLSLKLHPDKNQGNGEPFQDLGSAYGKLEKGIQQASGEVSMTQDSLQEIDRKHGFS